MVQTISSHLEDCNNLDGFLLFLLSYSLFSTSGKTDPVKSNSNLVSPWQRTLQWLAHLNQVETQAPLGDLQGCRWSSNRPPPSLFTTTQTLRCAPAQGLCTCYSSAWNILSHISIQLVFLLSLDLYSKITQREPLQISKTSTSSFFCLLLSTFFLWVPPPNIIHSPRLHVLFTYLVSLLLLPPPET